MAANQACPGCHKPLAPNAPDGLCPECLIKAGLGTGVDVGPDSEGGSGRTPFVAPSVEEVARLFPQLEILDFIGQGGMGAVYQARQKALDRIVALKILPPGIGKDPAFAERFTREAKALARLNHPGVVTLYEFGQADGLFYFLMEYVDGVSLRQLLEVERISAREALAIVPQICDALQYAHDQGIVHRDIKPENILLDRQGRVKVADFGLAKLVGIEALTPARSPRMGAGGVAVPVEGTPPPAALTEAGKVMGTPPYMAPEQREHPTDVDHRADIYSLGVVFYEMLTGELPGKPIEPPSRKVQIDVRLDEVVLRALEKEPQRRYQQVSQVRTAVGTIAASPPAARPSTGATGLASGAPGKEAIRRDLKGPAMGLVVAGILNLLLLPLAAWLIYQWAAPPSGDRRILGNLCVGLVVFAPLLCNFLLYAGFKMMRLEARGAALAASVLAVLIAPGNMVGLPLGVWAFRVLRRREVREAFAARKTSPPLRHPQLVWPWIGAAAGMVLLVPLVMLAVYFLSGQAAWEAGAKPQKLALEPARPQVQLAQQEFLRVEGLFKAGLVNQAEFEKAKAARDAAAAQANLPMPSREGHQAVGRQFAVQGKVCTPNGKPLEGVSILLATPQSQVSVYEDNGHGESIGKTSGDGKFSITNKDGKAAILLSSDAGYALVTPDDLQSNPEIVLKSWGRIEGVWRIGNTPAAHQVVNIGIWGSEWAWEWSIVSHHAAAETDEHGRFVFPRVAPGDVWLTRQVMVRPGDWRESGHQYLKMLPGQTNQVNLGATGRAVTGRIVWEASEQLMFFGSLWAKPRGAMPLPSGWKEETDEWRRRYERTWRGTPQGESFKQEACTYEFSVQPDGTFRIEDVRAGRYRLQVRAEAPVAGGISMQLAATADRDVDVPGLAGGQTDEPMDIGALHPKPVAASRTGLK